MRRMKNAALLLGLTVSASTAAMAQSTEDAVKAIDAEQYAKASGLLKRLIAGKAGDGQNYYYLGQVYLKQDHLDSAKATFTRGVQADQKNALNYIGLGEVELLNKNSAGANNNFEQAKKLIKKRDYAYNVELGRAYLAGAKPNYTAALEQFKIADDIDKDDKDPNIYTAIGDAYAMQNKNSEALSPYMQAVNLAGDQYRAKVQIGRMYKQSRAFPEAEKQLKEVVAKAPTYGPAYRELAELYNLWALMEPSKAQERYAQAIDNYKKYMANTDSSVESRIRYIQFLYYAKDFKTLQQETTQLAATLKPTDPNYRLVKRLQGYSMIENGQAAEGGKALKDMFANNKDTSKIVASDYFYLGKADYSTGNKAEGIKNMKLAVQRDSTNAEALAEVAQQLYKDKEFAQSADVYETVTAANKGGKGSLYNYFFKGLAYYWQYAMDFNAKKNPSKDLLKKADEAFNKVIAASPETADAYLWSARANRLMDSDTKPEGLASPVYEKYIQLVTVTKPDLGNSDAAKVGIVEAYNTIAATAAANGDKGKAREYYTKAKERDPANKTATDGLAGLK